MESPPPPPFPFEWLGPEETDDGWARTVDAFRGKYYAGDTPFPGYPIMLGHPVFIGVGADDITSAATGLEPGFEFSKILRQRIYGILVNDRVSAWRIIRF